MRIYTKTGDNGETSLLGGKRVKKSCIEMEVIGEIDELNASLGLLICELDPHFKETIQKLEIVQHQLFNIGSQLAAVQTDLITQIPQTTNQDVIMLEHWIDEMDKDLEVLTQFILPGGDRASAQSFLARAVCRRAERFLVGLMDHQELNICILQYINRLSDVLFTLGRFINMKNGNADVVWVKDIV
ncbi:MAG: cob(I)yrinic acid a,c-diamide adenosyltransferase [Candidatus Magasanikbacteria bacterium]|nr:cob(I)yrinic acid a,c-diamide adenosyltransferase [Candidatus Magasanikbacteria bacterium]